MAPAPLPALSDCWIGFGFPAFARRCRPQWLKVGKPNLRALQIKEHQIRTLLQSFDDHFPTVWRDIQILNVVFGSEVSQLPFGSRLKVDEPEILMLDLPTQE